jgi:hypothetical protein
MVLPPQQSLTCLGFHGSKSDSSLFICRTSTFKIYVLIYVDDIIITSSSSVAIDNSYYHLQADFAVKDLGSLKFFLGVEVIPNYQWSFAISATIHQRYFAQNQNA